MVISIPIGYVCIETDAYEAIVHDATKAEDIDAKVEAAFNRGYAEGKAAAYEEYIAECLRDKDKAVGYETLLPKRQKPRRRRQRAPQTGTQRTQHRRSKGWTICLALSTPLLRQDTAEGPKRAKEDSTTRSS